MFGDFGHGFIMTLAALYLVLNEKKFLNSKMGEVYKMNYFRYLICSLVVDIQFYSWDCFLCIQE